MRFMGIKPKFTGIKLRFTGIKPRFTGIKLRFTGIKPRFTGIKPRFTEIKPRFTGRKPRFTGVVQLKLDKVGHLRCIFHVFLAQGLPRPTYGVWECLRMSAGVCGCL